MSRLHLCATMFLSISLSTVSCTSPPRTAESAQNIADDYLSKEMGIDIAGFKKVVTTTIGTPEKVGR
jgi:hypothetical protein